MLRRRFGIADFFNNRDQIHHDNPIAKISDKPKVVADEDIGQAYRRLQLLQKRDDLGLNGHVQRRGRFIQDQKVGLHQ